MKELYPELIDYIFEYCSQYCSDSEVKAREYHLGFMYTLPMLVNFQAEVYHDGIVRLSLMREDIPITKRIRAGFMVNTDKEFMVDLRYIINRNMGIRTHYDSDMGFGVGLTLNY